MTTQATNQPYNAKPNFDPPTHVAEGSDNLSSAGNQLSLDNAPPSRIANVAVIARGPPPLVRSLIIDQSRSAPVTKTQIQQQKAAAQSGNTHAALPTLVVGAMKHSVVGINEVAARAAPELGTFSGGFASARGFKRANLDTTWVTTRWTHNAYLRISDRLVSKMIRLRTRMLEYSKP